MIPVLFKEDEQVFSHNGIGALYESLSCDVIEQENGSFTMELEYPVDGELFSEIKDFRIIQAKPNDIDEPHNFRIYEIVKSIDDLTVYVRANTRTNDLGNNLITEYVGYNITPQQAMDGIKNNLIEPTNFDLLSDIETTSSVEWTRLNPLNAIVGTSGSMVSIWGGEIKRTNTAIHLYSRRGRDNVVTIRPGKNILGLDMTVSTAGLVTKILPTYTYNPVNVPEYQMVTNSDGTIEKRSVPTSGGTTLRDDITVLGDVVSSQYVDNYPTNYWSSVDYGDDDELRDIIDEYIDTRLTAAEESPTILDMSGFEDDLKDFVKTELDKKAAQYFIYRNPTVDKPTVRMTVDMLQLSDSPDWEDFKNLEQIGLTDTLDVWVEEYDIDVEVRVTSLTYDSIGEEVKSFNAGSDRPVRQSVMEKRYDEFVKSTNDYITSFKNGVQNVMRNTADGLNRRFEGYTEPPAHLSSDGDIWFREIGEGKVEIWIHDGTYWQPLLTDDFADQIRADVEAAQTEAEAARATADATVNEINQVVNDNGFTTLEGLFASKVTGEEAETMFYQEAEAIGLVYMEDGVQKAIISIQDGTPYIKGENVILDGNTIVDGDFKVTGEMLADGAVIGQLEADGIDAQNVNIINLDAASISGGNLELSKGLKITHNGKVIFGVNAYNQIAMDEDIREELKGDDGATGANGQPTYTWVKYADTPTSGMNDYPADKKYIGLAFNQTTKTEGTSYESYQWSLMPQNIEIGGRNLLLGSGEPVSNATYNIARYDLTDDIKVGEEVTLTIWGELAATKTDFRAYNSGGSVQVTALKNNGNGTYSNTFKWTIGSSDNTYLNVYAFTNAQTGTSTINKIQLERGNTATDWTEAPEDAEARLTTRTNEIEDRLTDFVTVEDYSAEIGPINSALQDYKAQLEAGEISRDEAITEIVALVEKTAVIETNLGEFVEKWNFLDTTITFGSEGILVGDTVSDTGIRISAGRIDFVDNGSIVAEITGQLMKINRGIFVKSAQIGEHQIETISGGHTIFKWIPK